MKKSGASQGQSAAELISKRIAAHSGIGAGETLARRRQAHPEADPDVVEEWKCDGTGPDLVARRHHLHWRILKEGQ